jgi:hypothetical protein
MTYKIQIKARQSIIVRYNVCFRSFYADTFNFNTTKFDFMHDEVNIQHINFAKKK